MLGTSAPNQLGQLRVPVNSRAHACRSVPIAQGLHTVILRSRREFPSVTVVVGIGRMARKLPHVAHMALPWPYICDGSPPRQSSSTSVAALSARTTAGWGLARTSA